MVYMLCLISLTSKRHALLFDMKQFFHCQSRIYKLDSKYLSLWNFNGYREEKLNYTFML